MYSIYVYHTLDTKISPSNSVFVLFTKDLYNWVSFGFSQNSSVTFLIFRSTDWYRECDVYIKIPIHPSITRRTLESLDLPSHEVRNPRRGVRTRDGNETGRRDTGYSFSVRPSFFFRETKSSETLTTIVWSWYRFHGPFPMMEGSDRE